ncbi:unnamed protein product [Sphagnum balticum]
MSNSSSGTNAPNTQVDLGYVVTAFGGYTVDFLKRCNRAGVEPITIKAGDIVCSSFRFAPFRQKQLISSLNKLEGCFSSRNLIYLGFGVQHIVRELSVAENGFFLVALCSALTLHYSSNTAAEIMRELYIERKATSSGLPSMRQWMNLIESCQGCIAKSKLPYHFDAFARLLNPESREMRAPTDPQIIAKALLIIGEISMGRKSNARFDGGVECALLAVIAQDLFGLSIEIFDESNNNCCYISPPTGPVNIQTQITFIRRGKKENTSPNLNIVRETFFISTGRELLRERLHLDASPVRYPTSWSKVLSDTFPPREADGLFTNFLYRAQLNRLLRIVAYQAQIFFASSAPHSSIPESLWWIKWNRQGSLYNPKRTGSDLIRFISNTFPELAFIEKENPIETELLGDTVENDSIENCLKRISNNCRCSACREKSRRAPYPILVCRKTLATTIARLALILSPVMICPSIPPSINALHQLYDATNPVVPGASSGTISIPIEGLGLILYVFTGELSKSQPSRVSAVSAQGICVFMSLLRDFNLSPLEAMEVEVIHGNIQHEQDVYSYVTDVYPEAIYPDPSTKVFNPNDLWDGDRSTVELVAEARQDRIIAASYRCKPVGQHPPRTVYISTTSLYNALLTNLRAGHPHTEHCDQNVAIGPGPSRWSLCKQSVLSTQPPSSPYSLDVKALPPDQQTSWAILRWDTFDEGRGANSTQVLEIEVYRTESFFLHLLVTQMHTANSDLPLFQRRERCLVVELIECPACIVRVAGHAWCKAQRPQPYSQYDRWPVEFHKSKRKDVLIESKVPVSGKTDDNIKLVLMPATPAQEPKSEHQRSWSVSGLVPARVTGLISRVK